MLLRLFFFFPLLLAGSSNTKQKAAHHATRAPISIDPATVSTITGTITFSGDAPKPEKIDMSQDPACVFGTDPNFSQSFAVDKGKLQNVYVYVKTGLGNPVFPIPTYPATLAHHASR